MRSKCTRRGRTVGSNSSRHVVSISSYSHPVPGNYASRHSNQSTAESKFLSPSVIVEPTASVRVACRKPPSLTVASMHTHRRHDATASQGRPSSSHRGVQDGCMDFRYLGNSGMQISEITYGNWLTHGSQVENDVATQCVRAALDAGITSFDTADVYANGRAEQVLGAALKGERRESLEVFTKVYWPVGPDPKGKNDTGLSRKHIMEGIDGIAATPADGLRRSVSGAPLRRVHPARGDHAGVRRRGARRQGALHRRERVDRRSDPRRALSWPRQLGISLVSSQPQYSMLWRIIEGEVVPTCRRARHRPDRLVADRPGRADRQVPAGPGRAGGLARDRRQGRRGHDQAVDDGRGAHPRPAAAADRRRTRPVDGAAGRGLGAAERATCRPRSSGRPGRIRSPRTSRRPASRSPTTR